MKEEITKLKEIKEKALTKITDILSAPELEDLNKLDIYSRIYSFAERTIKDMTSNITKQSSNIYNRYQREQN